MQNLLYVDKYLALPLPATWLGNCIWSFTCMYQATFTLYNGQWNLIPLLRQIMFHKLVQCNYILFLGIVISNSSLKATDAVLELIFLNNLRPLHILAYFHCIKQRISDPTSIMIKHAFLKRLFGRILQYQLNLQAFRHFSLK